MVLGQSAATAAALAADRAVAVQDLPYAALRDRLLADGQVLDLPAGWRPKPAIDRTRLAGVVVDDDEAKLEGAWVSSSSISPFVGDGYRHDNQAADGPCRAIFSTALKPGKHEVRLAYTPHPNRGPSVAVEVHHAGGVTRLRWNQRTPPKIDGLFASLGVYRFDKEKPAEVRISSEGAGGFVIIDAVQFVPVD